MRSTETPSEAQRKLPLHTEEKGFEGNNRSAAIYATDILGETEQQQSSRLNGHDRKDLESTETQLPGARNGAKPSNLPNQLEGVTSSTDHWSCEDGSFKRPLAFPGKSQKSDSPGDSSLGTPLLTESSTRSIPEMFDPDEVLMPPTSGYRQDETFNSEESKLEHTDDWFNGDGDLLDSDDQRTSCTPPLSLYGFKQSLPTGTGGNPESSNASSFASSGRNTPNSSHSQIMGSITSYADAQSSSVGSNTTGSMPRSGPGSMTKPLLYSAIGSLENIHGASIQNLNRHVTAVKEFSHIGNGQSILIPPASRSTTLRGGRKENSRTLLAVDSQDLPYLSNKAARATPPASNQRKNASAEGTSSNKQSRAPSDQFGKTKDSKQSNLRGSTTSTSSKKKTNRSVSISKDSFQKKKKPIEMFRPSCDAYTPRIEKKRFEYKKAEQRNPVQKMASPMGTLSRPNFRDALRRVAMIIHQHIVKIERRFEGKDMRQGDKGLFKKSMRDTFAETNYCSPTYKCTMVRIPMARPGMVYGLRKIRTEPTIPSEEEIYEFAHQLFKAVQLSSECSIVCLIYVERLMEVAKVPLLANTWRPIFMCGLLLASKVWQDLSSWNIEFASVYPQYSLDAINRLELNFLRNVKWDLFISSSLYAKYYFALRSLVEKVDFRQRYNRMVGGVDRVAQSEALQISKRTEQFKEETLLQLSRSM